MQMMEYYLRYMRIEFNMIDQKKILSNLTILYAEDNIIVRDLITKILKIIFKNVIVAKNGEEAIALYNQEKIDIILLDYIMPIVDGCHVANEIRKVDEDIPIIIASGHTDEEKLLKAIDLNIIKYIKKPINFNDLDDALYKSVVKLKKLNRLYVNLGESVKYDSINKIIINPQNLEIKLTKQEIKLIELLIKNKNSLVSKDLIIENLFDKDAEDNTVRNLIYRTRKKISPKKIETIKDLGYIMH